MISCTQFIPAYSELFSFLDDQYGREEVSKLWEFLFEPSGEGIPLINYAKKDGLRGCWDYWVGALTEEAADVTCYLNEEEGWLSCEMHYCPSKGRLLEMEASLHVKPYYDYCAHCDYYRSALDLVGLKWIRNHIHVDKASCSSVLYDPARFKGTMSLNDKVEVVEITPSEQEYFHRDFHSSMNMGIHYLGEKHGDAAVYSFFERYVSNVCASVCSDIQNNGLIALRDWIQDTYQAEKASDVLNVVLENNRLSVSVSACPAVSHLRSTGRLISPWFRKCTEYVMMILAEKVGLGFSLDAYDELTGAQEYHFFKK